MTSGSTVWVRILEHCISGFLSITPLIDKAMTRSTLYRWKDKLLEKGWLETDGKDKYKTTAQGLLQLQTASGEVPKGLSTFYPPLGQVPTLQHKATIELAVAAIIARRYNLRFDRHPTLIIAGPTLTWKTSMGVFLCHMLGLDPSRQIVNLAAESGRSLWLRKTSMGRIAYKRELLETPLVVFDEYQAADPECRRLLGLWMDGRKNVAVENQQLTIEAVPLITLNPSQGNALEARIGISKALVRRSIICDLSDMKLPNLAMKGEDIVNAAKARGSLEFPKPRHDCNQYKAEIHRLLLSTLNQQGQELVDLETVTMLCSAMTGFLEPVEAIRLIFHDCLLLWDTLGWTKPGWAMHVKSFPTTLTGNTAISNPQSNSEIISDEDWIRALEHLETGGTVSELITKLHFTIEESALIAKKYNELKTIDAKVHTPSPDSAMKSQDVLKLEHEVRIVELQQKKAELLRPIEIDKTLTAHNATFDATGSWKQEHCIHMNNNYCMHWQWEKRPDFPYQVGEPLLKYDEWYILPTFLRCAVCSSYQEPDTSTPQNLERRLSTAERSLKRKDRIIAALSATFEDHGTYKRQRCSHLQDSYCMFYTWGYRPNSALMVGSPRLREDNWYYQPTSTYCALCPEYFTNEDISIQTLDASIKDIQKTLAATPISNLKVNFKCSNCRSKDFVAVKIRCTKCKTETWWGWHLK